MHVAGLPSPQLSGRRYFDARRHAVCVSAALVSAAALYPVLCGLFCCFGIILVCSQTDLMIAIMLTVATDVTVVWSVRLYVCK